MAVPKKKTTKSRRDMRRSHDRLAPIFLVECESCGQKKMKHHMCKYCETYHNKAVRKAPLETPEDEE
ncbi:50S ribosomal protein L32 [Alphaproteobacteria bacterium]|nr:50S ribosomal protein L32 [Alphaproteobacteria bacterium]GHS96909.1 50S ribosomal protein L32 [Alphaproteobacteria bacterium]